MNRLYLELKKKIRNKFRRISYSYSRKLLLKQIFAIILFNSFTNRNVALRSPKGNTPIHCFFQNLSHMMIIAKADCVQELLIGQRMKEDSKELLVKRQTRDIAC